MMNCRIGNLTIIGVLFGVVWATSTPAHAADVTVGADVLSSYIWRGVTINKDTVVQPSLAVEHDSGLALEVWANFDIGDNDGEFEKRQFSEIDFDVSYTLDLNPISVTLGYIEYTYPCQIEDLNAENGDDDGEETDRFGRKTADRDVYVRIATELPPGIEMDLTVYQDLSTSDGTYARLTGVYEFQVNEKLVLGLKGSVGYGAKDATASGKAGWHDYLVGISADYEVADVLTVGVFAHHVGSLDSDVLPSEAVVEDVYGGLGLYYSF